MSGKTYPQLTASHDRLCEGKSVWVYARQAFTPENRLT